MVLCTKILGHYGVVNVFECRHVNIVAFSIFCRYGKHFLWNCPS